MLLTLVKRIDSWFTSISLVWCRKTRSRREKVLLTFILKLVWNLSSYVDIFSPCFWFLLSQQSSLGLISDAKTIRRNIVDDFSCEVTIWVWLKRNDDQQFPRAGCTATTRTWPTSVSCSTCATPSCTRGAGRRSSSGASSVQTRQYSIRWGQRPEAPYKNQGSCNCNRRSHWFI